MEPGYERFEVNEYDLEQAYNPLRRRKFRTKNDQIYGIWNDEEEDNSENDQQDGDEDVPGTSDGKSRGRRVGRRTKDYSAPINFISGGVKQGDKISKENDEDEDEQDNDADDDDNSADFRNRKFTRNKKKPAHLKMPRLFGTDSFAGLRNKPGNTAGAELFADWERYTKGIGSKLLSKMGHKQGSGLGRDAQGIAEPIQAALRPGRGAVGMYGSETKQPKLGKQSGESGKKKDVGGQEGTNEKDDLEKSGLKVKGQQWRKEPGQRQQQLQQQPKYRYKTWDEVVSSENSSLKKQWVNETQSSIKIIDMTGKEQKIYSGYDEFLQRDNYRKVETKESDEQKNFDIPELRYNLDLLVNMTEENIIRNDRQLKFLKDQNVTLAHEENELTKKISFEQRESELLQKLLDLLDDFNEKSINNDLTLDDCKLVIQTLQGQFYTEYKLFSLSDLAITNVLPLVKEYFASWQIFDEPARGVDLMLEWKRLIEESGNWTTMERMDPFHRIIWDAWMPHIRRATLNWEPRDFDKMINVLEAWMPVLPAWIMENILEQLILPRIHKEVEDWNPTSDTLPIHSWLHPWLPLMGDRLQPVYAPIRHKLSLALSQWDPRDPSAKMILQPWTGVFARGTMDCFLVQNILPKLVYALHNNFEVNPADQKLDVWHWLMQWLDMLGPDHIANTLVRHFFPKWHEALYTWLTNPNVNYNEVSQWYIGWKSLFSEALLSIPFIQEQFNKALEMMNAVLSGHKLTPPIYHGNV